MSDAEALLLVHDDEAEVAERDVFREQAMRADDDVDVARLDPLDDLLLLLVERKREMNSIVTGKAAKRERKVSKCW